MANQEVYHSSTLGPIPLSFTGRRLMQNLREAVQELVSASRQCAELGIVLSSDSWKPVSEARGKLAQYMSMLERKQVPQSMLDELARLRAFEAAVRPHLPPNAAVLDKRFGHEVWHRPPKNQYLVRVIEDGPTIPNKRVERKPGSLITTEMRIGGSITILAYNMDEALGIALKQAHDHGFTELKRTDFDVRLLSVPEA